jgi:hypothetical protein
MARALSLPLQTAKLQLYFHITLKVVLNISSLEFSSPMSRAVISQSLPFVHSSSIVFTLFRKRKSTIFLDPGERSIKYVRISMSGFTFFHLQAAFCLYNCKAICRRGKYITRRKKLAQNVLDMKCFL